MAETINGLDKADVIHRRGSWRSMEAVELATLEWVDWFNNRRLMEPIGNIPPEEAEDRDLSGAAFAQNGETRQELHPTRSGSVRQIQCQLAVWLATYAQPRGRWTRPVQSP